MNKIATKTLTIKTAKLLLKRGSPVVVVDTFGVSGLLKNVTGYATAVVDWPTFPAHRICLDRIRLAA